MQKNSSIINKIYTNLFIQFIVCFGFYILIFGEVSPGGGFQAGAIFASCFIGWDLSSSNSSQPLVSKDLLIRLASLGIIIYILIGAGSFIYNSHFLDYSFIASDHPRATGIVLVEFAITLTVSTVLVLIYNELRYAN